MFARYPLLGSGIGLLAGAVSAFVLSPGYERSDSVIGTAVLGALAGYVIGLGAAAVTLALRHARNRQARRRG